MCQTKGDWVCKSTDEGKKGLDVYDTYEKTRAIAERNEFGAFSVFPILFCFCKPPVSNTTPFRIWDYSAYYCQQNLVFLICDSEL